MSGGPPVRLTTSTRSSDTVGGGGAGGCRVAQRRVPSAPASPVPHSPPPLLTGRVRAQHDIDDQLCTCNLDIRVLRAVRRGEESNGDLDTGCAREGESPCGGARRVGAGYRGFGDCQHQVGVRGGHALRKVGANGARAADLDGHHAPCARSGGGGAQGAVSSQRASSAAQHTAAAHARPPPAAAGSPFTCWWTS